MKSQIEILAVIIKPVGHQYQTMAQPGLPGNQYHSPSTSIDRISRELATIVIFLPLEYTTGGVDHQSF
jgi:hypothetical protein